MMFYQPLVDKLMSLLGHGVVLSSAFVLSPANFASASLTPPAIYQFSSSASQTVENLDHSQDLQQLTRELAIAKALLSGLGTEIDGAMSVFIEQLNAILDSAMAVDRTELPKYSRPLADLLRAARGDLLNGVDKVSTWARLARIVEPGTNPVVPERFITRRPEKSLEFSPTDLQIAAYLRSERGPQVA